LQRLVKNFDIIDITMFYGYFLYQIA